MPLPRVLLEALAMEPCCLRSDSACLLVGFGVTRGCCQRALEKLGLRLAPSLQTWLTASQYTHDDCGLPHALVTLTTLFVILAPVVADWRRTLRMGGALHMRCAVRAGIAIAGM